MSLMGYEFVSAMTSASKGQASCRAGNAFTGRRIRDGETGLHPARVEILRDELTQVL